MSNLPAQPDAIPPTDRSDNDENSDNEDALPPLSPRSSPTPTPSGPSPRTKPLSAYHVDSSKKAVPPPLIKSSPSFLSLSSFSLTGKKAGSTSSLSSLESLSHANSNGTGSSPSTNNHGSLAAGMRKSPSREKLLQKFEKSRLKNPTAPTKVLSFIYIGDRESTLLPDALQKEGITHMLALSTSFKNPDKEETGITSKHLPMSDYGEEDLAKVFKEEALPFIQSCKDSGGKILISCRMGMNRSATIVLAWLMMEEFLCLADAYRYLLNRHPQIRPHRKYVEQLGQMEVDFFEDIQQTTLLPEDIEGSSSQHAHILSALLPESEEASSRSRGSKGVHAN